MKAQEIRSLSVEDLNKKVKDYKIELFNLRFQSAVNKLTNPMRIKKVKKNIARIYTILTEKSKII